MERWSEEREERERIRRRTTRKRNQIQILTDARTGNESLSDL